MLRRAFVVGIAGWLTAQEPVPTPPSPAQAPAATSTPRAQAEQFVRELAEPCKQNAAVQGLVALGDAAVPALHKALLDRRSDVLQWALFACSGLSGDCASLRAPVDRLLASKDLGVAMMARRAWHAVEGRHGLLLTMQAGDVILVTATGEERLCRLPDPYRAALLPNGHLLAVSLIRRTVRELDADGNEVWAVAGRAALDGKRLPDGNSLVCCFENCCVVQLKPSGEVAWSHNTDGIPFAADRFANGNTLITLISKRGLIEVDRAGQTVWSHAGNSGERLLDGTTLVTEEGADRVLLVAAGGKVLRTWNYDDPIDATLLPNGHLVVKQRHAVAVLDANGETLWRLERPLYVGMQVLGAGPFPAHAAPVNTAPKKP